MGNLFQGAGRDAISSGSCRFSGVNSSDPDPIATAGGATAKVLVQTEARPAPAHSLLGNECYACPMKSNLLLRPFRILTVTLILTGLVMLVGCATTKRVDWAARVGNFTFDQAVEELGPPDKQTTLSDGRIVADWVTRRSGRGVGIGTGIGMGGVGVGVGHSIGSSKNHVLRLTFHQEGQLEMWLQE
jgi:hypothetical protein